MITFEKTAAFCTTPINLGGDFKNCFGIAVWNFYIDPEQICLTKYMGAIILPLSNKYSHLFRTSMKPFVVLDPSLAQTKPNSLQMTWTVF